MLLRMLSVSALSAMAMSSAVAEEAKGPWKSEAELGVVMTGGNTESETIKAKGKLEYAKDRWTGSFALDSLYASTDDETTAERYGAKAQAKYNFSGIQYVYGLIDYEKDRFSGFDYRVSESLGYGATVLDNGEVVINVEGGPGARQSKLEDGGSDSEALFRLFAGLDWQISEPAKFHQELSSEIGEDTTISESISELHTQVNGSLAMKVSYTLKHTSDVPEGVKNTDRETAVTLVYSFN